MPTDVPAIGPTNKWYIPGMAHAIDQLLPNGSTIKLLTAPYFIATKFEAFKSRGGDMRTSKDFEDIVYILDSRSGVEDELKGASPKVHDYLCKEFNALLKLKSFAEAIAGHLDPRISAARSQLLRGLLRRFVVEVER